MWKITVSLKFSQLIKFILKEDVESIYIQPHIPMFHVKYFA